tara:strand:+ start:57 stop:353 length:297 start_codon:yes stop_codon:yes gene_type:complete
MIKLKDLLKESIGGLVCIPAINAPMKYEEKKPIKELEYTPGDLKKINDMSQELGKTFRKMANQLSRDLDIKENRVVGKTLKAYNSYFAELKKMNKVLK